MGQVRQISVCLTSSAVFSVPFPIDCKGYIGEKTKSALDELKSFGQNIHRVLNVHRKNCSLEKRKKNMVQKQLKPGFTMTSCKVTNSMRDVVVTRGCRFL